MMSRRATSMKCALSLIAAFWLVLMSGCSNEKTSQVSDNELDLPSAPMIDRAEYKNKLYGFWLGQCIANWSGLVTEMDKIGSIGEMKTGDFYTREDWGQPDQPSIWGEGVPSDLSSTIDYVFRDEKEVWGADDDTDIEYIYQQLIYQHHNPMLTPAQIRGGWLKHIKKEEENYLWVSNQKAFDLMQSGMLPPNTGDPANNEHYEMIDAQLTTEIFGLFAPGNPAYALRVAELPIMTSARHESADIARFYVVMHSLAGISDTHCSIPEQLMWMADSARSYLDDAEYPAKMYDFVKGKYASGILWEQARDSIYVRYQVNQKDGYDITSQELYCNGCFAAGINFASSLVSLFYGEGDLKETIKIGMLSGWDSDNPTATWGGLMGFMLGKEGVEVAFDRKFADQFNIHRTRIGFENDGIDRFDHMAEVGVEIVDMVMNEMPGARVDSLNGVWYFGGNL
ncbi:MAG: ADP-ribosylglycohydrolase family protein [Cyclobacteriaceae bacterium]